MTVVSVTVHVVTDIIFNEYEALRQYGVIYLLRFSFLHRARGQLRQYEEFR